MMKTGKHLWGSCMHQAMEEWAKIKRELGPCIQEADILLVGYVHV